MTINLHTLVNDIRDELGDVRPDIISDEGIYREIKKANVYIQMIKDEDYDDEDNEREVILALATYYTYMNFTSIMEGLSGELGYNTTKKTQYLKEIALMFMKQITSTPLNDNLMIDESMYKVGGIGFGITEDVWS